MRLCLVTRKSGGKKIEIFLLINRFSLCTTSYSSVLLLFYLNLYLIFILFIFRFLAFLIVDEILDFVLCTAFGKRQDTRPSIIFELGSIDSLFSSD